MNVKQLKEMLANFDDDAEIVTEMRDANGLTGRYRKIRPIWTFHGVHESENVFVDSITPQGALRKGKTVKLWLFD